MKTRKKKGGCLKIFLIVFGVICALGLIGIIFGNDDKQEETTFSSSISAVENTNESTTITTTTISATTKTSTTTTTKATDAPTTTKAQTTTKKETSTSSFDISKVPAYKNSPYIAINDNVPDFVESDMKTFSFETYSRLDSRGRCGVAYACIGQDLMPTEKRGAIGMIKPTGWHTVKYDFVDGKYLYNRCHLIGYQLTAENANERNLITGTRYMNVQGMLPFENMVADYIKETDNHVLYRVTPVFEGKNLVASGVQMEAYSVEDDGDGVEFNVYCYNVQPGIDIDYETGESWLTGNSGTDETTAKTQTTTGSQATTQSSDSSSGTTYVLNTNSKKFHYPSCSSVGQMNESNKEFFTGSRDEVISRGYDPCGRCNP